MQVPPGHIFPPIRDPNALPRRVLVLAAHPDDEVIGIGALLAFHGQRGDRVRVVHATRGDAGDPEGRHAEIAQLREQEMARALEVFGLPAAESFGLPDGGLDGHAAELRRQVRELFEEDAPELLYTFHGGEYHADHRQIAWAACEERGHLPEHARVLLFGVNQVVSFGALYEYSARVELKQRALACFETQLAYLDFASKVMHRDQAATVNVEDPAITHAELLLEVDRASWAQHIENCGRALRDACPELFGGSS